MKSICLDTRILSQYLNKKQKARDVIFEFQQQGYEVYTTTINVAEFFMGVYKVVTPSVEKLERLKDFFYTLHPRSLDYDVALEAGHLFSTVLKGNAIGWRDTFIAAIVLHNGKMIVTGNPDHFNRIPGLEIVEYF